MIQRHSVTFARLRLPACLLLAPPPGVEAHVRGRRVDHRRERQERRSEGVQHLKVSRTAQPPPTRATPPLQLRTVHSLLVRPREQSAARSFNRMIQK